MIIYEVNLKIEQDVVDDYLKWLSLHIKDILKLPGFLNAHLNKVSNLEYVVQYSVESKEKLELYFENHADNMRQDGINKFGNKFSANRRIMEVVRKY